MKSERQEIDAGETEFTKLSGFYPKYLGVSWGRESVMLCATTQNRLARKSPQEL